MNPQSQWRRMSYGIAAKRLHRSPWQCVKLRFSSPDSWHRGGSPVQLTYTQKHRLIEAVTCLLRNDEQFAYLRKTPLNCTVFLCFSCSFDSIGLKATEGKKTIPPQIKFRWTGLMNAPSMPWLFPLAYSITFVFSHSRCMQKLLTLVCSWQRLLCAETDPASNLCFDVLWAQMSCILNSSLKYFVEQSKQKF